jgi:endonuclease/exonuclease/phosphatase family metal-dependent hydrolase
VKRGLRGGLQDGLRRQLRPAFSALLALVLTAGLTTGRAQADSPIALTVATYNLRLNLASDGANAWPQRRAAVQALIRYHGFDVFGTQEGLPEQIRDLEQLAEFGRVGVGRDDGSDAGEHSAIFYRRERLQLLAHGDFWLSPTPEVPSMGWDARCCKRLATWVRLRDQRSGRTLSVVSAHFDHEGLVAQRESAQLLLRWVAAQQQQHPADAVIALGDFNLRPDSAPIAALRATLRDSRLISLTPPYGPAASFNDFKFGAPPSELIDYIFVGPRIRVLRHAVLTDSDGSRYPSDHFPVLSRIELE